MKAWIATRRTMQPRTHAGMQHTDCNESTYGTYICKTIYNCDTTVIARAACTFGRGKITLHESFSGSFVSQGRVSSDEELSTLVRNLVRGYSDSGRVYRVYSLLQTFLHPLSSATPSVFSASSLVPRRVWWLHVAGVGVELVSDAWRPGGALGGELIEKSYCCVA